MRFKHPWVGRIHRLGPKGDGYLYEVPSTQRGFLSAYRGHLVRLVVTGHSRTERMIRVGLFNRDLLLAPVASEQD